MRLKFLKSTEAKQRLSKLVSDDNVQKVIDAPVCAIIGMDTEFWKDLPKNYLREDAKKYFNIALTISPDFQNAIDRLKSI